MKNLMKNLIVLLIVIIGFNCFADGPSSKDIERVVDIIGGILDKTINNSNSNKSKPVDTKKVYISRAELEALLKDAKDRGKAEGYKKGYRDGYRDGYKDKKGVKNVQEKSEEVRNNKTETKHENIYKW